MASNESVYGTDRRPGEPPTHGLLAKTAVFVVFLDFLRRKEIMNADEKIMDVIIGNTV